MSHEAADAAIDLLVRDCEDRSNALHAAIMDRGDGFAAACNTLSLRVAKRFVDGTLDFEAADDVMNWVWSWIVFGPLEAGKAMPEPAASIYFAVDAGEFHRPDDGPDVDPVQKYTTPGVVKILADSA